LALVLCLTLCAGPAYGQDRIVLSKSGPPGTISIPENASPTVRYAADALRAAVAKIEGPQLRISEGNAPQSVIVLATRDCPGVTLTASERESLGEEAYLAKVLVGADAGRKLVLVGGGERGLLYGAVRLSDFGLRVDGQDVVLEADGKVHAPALAIRGNYTLACWGKTHLWTRQHWCGVFDAMSADSMNVVLFWLSGLFPSKQYPASVTYPESRINVEDMRAMIRHAHARGMKFLIGSGIFAWFGVDALAERFPETRAVGSGGMCPSHPLARKINRECLLEMLDALPEADGFFLEIRDEYGPCNCAACQRRLDQRGSKQYGQAELSFLKEFTEEVWRRSPKAILVSSIGYGAESRGAHTDDVLFYEGVRQLADPRLFWMVCRNNWDFPAAEGPAKPLRWFSANMLQWTQYYRLSTTEIGAWVRRSRDAGCAGFVPALEPGFCSASWYSDEVPYPVDRIPYLVTRFAYREYCWDPDMTEEEFRSRLLRRFFGPDAPAHLAEDLLLLFDLIRVESQNGRLTPDGKWSRGCMTRLVEEAQQAATPMAQPPRGWTRLQQRLRALQGVGAQRQEPLQQFDERLRQAMPKLDPRGRETAGLMLQTLADTRAELCLDAESQGRLQEAVANVERLAERLKKDAPATTVAESEYNDTTYAAWRVLDGDPTTSWLCKDRARLPQTITVTLREKRTIDYVKLVQGSYHLAYNTRAFRVEVSPDGKTFSPLFDGEFENRLGTALQRRFAPVEALAVRVVITSVYPNVDYSSPSLAEIEIGLGSQSWTSAGKP
jgi:hypothetical protein